MRGVDISSLTPNTRRIGLPHLILDIVMLSSAVLCAGCTPMMERSNQSAAMDGLKGMYEGIVTVDSSSMVLQLRCESESRCEMTSITTDSKRDRKIHIDSFNSIASVTDLAEVKYALKYVRDRRSNTRGSKEDSVLVMQLHPLLDSDGDIAKCMDLNPKERGYLLACTIKNSPWNNSAVLLFGTLLANCGPFFCRYVIYPLFRR